MWLKGYGTYIEIDKKVEEGELMPFKNYPENVNKEIQPDKNR